MSPKGISTNSGPILRICKKVENLGTIFDYFQSKQCEIHVFEFRITQNYSIVIFVPQIYSLCPPKGISTKSGLILRMRIYL